MTENGTFTDYMVKAAATSLKTAGKIISDSLLIEMILKGPLLEFKMFPTVTDQKTLTFFQFKGKLSAFQESEKSCTT